MKEKCHNKMIKAYSREQFFDNNLSFFYLEFNLKQYSTNSILNLSFYKRQIYLLPYAQGYWNFKYVHLSIPDEKNLKCIIK